MSGETRWVDVEVTADDIERGRPNAWRCPLARAIRRVVAPRPVAVFGGLDGTYELGNDGMRYLRLGGDALKFIADFDSHRPVSPGRYRVEVPA